jgi:hypothetical protein
MSAAAADADSRRSPAGDLPGAFSNFRPGRVQSDIGSSRLTARCCRRGEPRGPDSRHDEAETRNAGRSGPSCLRGDRAIASTSSSSEFMKPLLCTIRALCVDPTTFSAGVGFARPRVYLRVTSVIPGSHNPGNRLPPGLFGFRTLALERHWRRFLFHYGPLRPAGSAAA